MSCLVTSDTPNSKTQTPEEEEEEEESDENEDSGKELVEADTTGDIEEDKLSAHGGHSEEEEEEMDADGCGDSGWSVSAVDHLVFSVLSTLRKLFTTCPVTMETSDHAHSILGMCVRMCMLV